MMLLAMKDPSRSIHYLIRCQKVSLGMTIFEILKRDQLL